MARSRKKPEAANETAADTALEGNYEDVAVANDPTDPFGQAIAAQARQEAAQPNPPAPEHTHAAAHEPRPGS